MRKKTISHLFDTAMWYLIYLLPLFILLLSWLRRDYVSLSSAMTTCGLGIFVDNPILTSLSSMFGASGMFPIFNNPDLLCYLTYFICVMIIHIFVDVLLFVVRLAHNWLDGVVGGKE